MILRLVHILLLVILLQSVLTYPTKKEGKSIKNIAKKHRHLNSHSLGPTELEYIKVDEPVVNKDASATIARKNKRSRKNKKTQGNIRRSSRKDGSSSGPSDQLLGLGVFGDMKKFFDELRTNLDTAQLTDDSEIEDQYTDLAETLDDREELPNYQEYRTGLDSDRRRSRLRNFVSMSDPVSRGNQYDPGYQWTGLGR